jgi:hypothetical protein
LFTFKPTVNPVEIAMVELEDPISRIDLGFLFLGYLNETRNLAEFWIMVVRSDF